MKKEILKIATIFLITIGVVVWGLNYIFFGAPKSKATGETMNLSFTPATATVAANADFTVNILAKPSINAVLRGYKVNVNFDKTKLAFKSIQYKVGIASAGLSNTTADIASINSSGIVYIVGEDTTAIGSTLTAVNGAEIASITFTALATTATTVTMTDSSFYSVNSDGTLFDTWTIAPTNLDVNGGGTTGGTCTSFTDDFSGTALNTGNWSLWTNNGGTAGFTTPAGEATLFLPASTVPKGTTLDSFDKRNIDGGDFIAELTLKSIGTLDNKNVAISSFSIDAKANDSRGIRIERRSDNGFIAAIFDNVAGNGGEIRETKDIALTNNMPIKVKIERINNVVKTFYDKLDGQGYQILKQFDGSYTESSRIDFGIFNATPDFPQASGTFDNFSLTCIPPPTGFSSICSAPGTSGTISWSAVSGATKYLLRVDDLTNSWTGVCTTSGDNPGDVCEEITTTSKTFTTTPGHIYHYWVHSCNSLGCSSGAGAPNFTCSSTGGTTGNVKLNLKLKFQGINKLPATGQNSMNVRAAIYKEGVTNALGLVGTGAFVADANGIWSGTIGVEMADISGKYKILVKGPHHIQKKICNSTPTETAGPGLYGCGDGNITLVVGDNNLDFSGILLLAGDLDQSGIVDSVDFGMVRNNLGKTDVATLTQADINRDGKVDTQDFSLIIAALGIRTDEL